MKFRFIGIILCLAVPVCMSAKNNDWPKVKQDCDAIFKTNPDAPEPLWKKAMACGTDFFTARPVHLTVQSIVPGGGFGPGLTFHEDFNSGKWQKQLEAT